MNNKVLVVNRAACSVSYNIPELHVERSFRPLGQAGDRMMISREELKALSYLHGGKILLDKYLMIEEADLQEELGITVEPEYTYTLEEIRELLTTGTEAQLEDCLNFAPAGVLDLLKREAIAMRLDSHKKRSLISEKLGITVEPEYTYTLEEIRELLTTGTEAQLEDCLNFAPAGVLDLLKREAIAMRLDSHKKRSLISEKLGINLEAMIKNDIIIKSSEETATAEAPTTTTRKAAPVKRKSTPVKK